MLSRVDLPQPEWPMMATYSPWSILRSMPLSTSLTIEPRANDLLTPSICRNGRPGGCGLGVVWETAGNGCDHRLPPQVAATPRVAKWPTSATRRSRTKPMTPM